MATSTTPLQAELQSGPSSAMTLGAVCPGTGTRSGAQERHLEPVIFHNDFGHGSRVLFHQRLEHVGDLLNGDLFGVLIILRFCNSLPRGTIVHINAKLCFETFLDVIGSELFSFVELRLFDDPSTLDPWP